MSLHRSPRLIIAIAALISSAHARQLAAQEPSAQQPSAQQPSAQPPSAQEPSAQQPSAQEPSAQAPSAQAPSAQVPAAQAPVEISAAPGQGLTVDVGPRFSLNLRTRVQLRYQLNVSPEDAAGDRALEQLVNIGTLRLWLSGHVFTPALTYMIQLALAGRDYRDGATSPVFDAYVDFEAHRDLSLRAGQFFVPFDRLRTVREWALQLADRPQPVGELTLDRDVGIALYSDNFLADDSPLAWRVGLFGGGGTNLSLGREPGALLVGRLELRPLGAIDDDREGDLQRRAEPGLALGAALAHNWNTNRLRSTTGATFSGGTTDYLHAAVDLVFKWRGFALQAEYLWKEASSDAVVSVDELGSPLREPTRSGHGWVLQSSYVFDPPIEVVARMSRLYAASDSDPAWRRTLGSEGQELAAGVNYYFNGHWFKIQADWIAHMPRNTHFDRADHLLHVQLDATF